MQNDPTQGSSHPNAINHPVHQEAAVVDNKYSDQAGKSKEGKNTGLPKRDDEETAEEESTSEDFVKFNVDKVKDLNQEKTDAKDEE